MGNCSHVSDHEELTCVILIGVKRKIPVFWMIKDAYPIYRLVNLT